MKCSRFFRSIACCSILAGPFLSTSGQAQTAAEATPLVTAPIDAASTVTLHASTRPEANWRNDRGLVGEDLAMEHMLLQLNRPADREQALSALIEAQHQSGNAQFHKWLTPEELGTRFGPNPADIQAISKWLTAQGFTVNGVSKSGITIDFSGTAHGVKAAFGTEIHNLDVRGAHHIANMQEVKIPAALASAVVGVVSLNDFRPHPANTGIAAARIDAAAKRVVARAPAGSAKPNFDTSAGNLAVVPDDLHTIYNFEPVYANGVTGKGQTVVVIEDTDVYSVNDWNVFRSTFGLSKYKQGSFTQIHPGGCTDPGVLPGDDGEAILDAEYSSAAAPNAKIVLASCANTEATFGGLLAFNALIDRPAPPSIISISYGECEAGLGSAGNATYRAAYQQATAEGVSVFVSSGDEGAASCDAGYSAAELGISVSGFASTPYNVAVGGTDFGDAAAGTTSRYWNAKNNATYGSAKGYIPEIPWDDSCASVLISHALGYAVPYGANGACNSPVGEEYFLTVTAGSGGPSGCAYGDTSPLDGTPAVSGTCQGYAKPSYQAGTFGNPGDGVRDIPDVSLFAANGVFGHYYVFCYSDPVGGLGGAPCTGDPSNWSGAGGTSFAAPIVAGVQALINQSTGESSQGNPNYVYYALAKQQYSAKGPAACNSSLNNGPAPGCVFNDVTVGDMDVNCLGPFNCYTPSGTNGVLSVSSSSYEPAYGTTPGWDFATGIGTLNVANLVKSWPTYTY